MKLMALDGNSIVNRAFYGVSQNLTTRDGQPTNAVFGFLAILLAAMTLWMQAGRLLGSTAQ